MRNTPTRICNRRLCPQESHRMHRSAGARTSFESACEHVRRCMTRHQSRQRRLTTRGRSMNQTSFALYAAAAIVLRCAVRARTCVGDAHRMRHLRVPADHDVQPQNPHQDNDIVMCDGPCNRAYHEACSKPPFVAADIPDDCIWYCSACDAKVCRIRWTRCTCGPSCNSPRHRQTSLTI